MQSLRWGAPGSTACLADPCGAGPPGKLYSPARPPLKAPQRKYINKNKNVTDVALLLWCLDFTNTHFLLMTRASPLKISYVALMKNGQNMEIFLYRGAI